MKFDISLCYVKNGSNQSSLIHSGFEPYKHSEYTVYTLKQKEPNNNKADRGMIGVMITHE